MKTVHHTLSRVTATHFKANGVWVAVCMRTIIGKRKPFRKELQRVALEVVVTGDTGAQCVGFLGSRRQLPNHTGICSADSACHK